ncbi:MAG: NfeD family protein [Prevotella sp.]|nr:NfeD family protein [Prevotella sp.]
MIEYFAANLWQMWVLIAVLCLILELTNGDFYVMCFAIGAAFTTIVSAIGIMGFYAQLVVFVICSVLCIFFVRPFALKYLHGKHKERLSNADALIGQIGRVSETIVDGGFGRVAIDGDDWKAVSSDGSCIDKDVKVRVVGRESIIITVEKV